METDSKGAGVIVGATDITAAGEVMIGGAGIGGRVKGRGAGSGGNSPVVTFILARMYVELPGDLLLISDFSSGEPARLLGRPSTVLDGSSANVCVSERGCLERQRGVVSAGLASTSITRTDGGKMETGM